MTYHLSFDLSFSTNTYPGKYYAIEGIDGSGKTTQVQKLSEYFEKQGKDVFITKEPGNDPIGRLIKQVLHKELELSAISLQYLFAAERALHIKQNIIPALEQGKIVISHRSLWSALAYGIIELHLPDNEKERLLVAYNILAIYGGYLIPDKTFIIDIPAEVAIERIKQRNIQITHYENQNMLQKVRKEYLWMTKKFSAMLIMIDGTKTIEEVHRTIIERLYPRR